MNNEPAADHIVRYEAIPGVSHLVRVWFNTHAPVDIPIKVWVDCGYKIGDAVTTAELASMEQHGNVAVATDKALRYLRLKPRTRQEIVRYLTNNGFEAEHIEQVILTLSDAGYIDDEAYVELYVRSKGQTVSRHELQWRLEQRGISKRVVVSRVDEVRSAGDEMAAAQRLARRQWLRHAGDEPTKRRNRVGAFLQRKGFSMGIIYSVLDSLVAEQDDDTRS